MEPQELEQVFKNLSPTVQQFIRILFTRKKETLRGVGRHTSCTCPVATAFNVNADVLWSHLTKDDREKLEKAGFSQEIYQDGTSWYDSLVLNEACHGLGNVPLLRSFLSLDQLPS